MFEYIAFILLFLMISAAEISTRQRAIDRKILRRRAVIELSVKFILVIVLYVIVDIIYRAWVGASSSIFLIPKMWLIFGFGMAAVYFGMISRMLKKLSDAGAFK